MSQNQATNIQNHILRRFNILKKVGSGAYGHVWKVEQKSTKRIMALKKIFDAFQHATDAQRTYRQIQILKQLEHPNIIKLHETIRADNNKDVYLLFQFMEADLHNVVSQGILKDVHIRFIIYQTAKALKYLHSANVIHRDLKPSNILVNSNCSIKLCDFGLVRSLNISTQSQPVLTQGVATRWYRAPQVLLGSKSYSTPADIWSFGCIIYQILAQKPLFPGNSTLDQIQKICSFSGYPSQQDIISLQSEVSKSMIKQIKVSTSKFQPFLKDFSPQFTDLLEKILVFNPNKRIKIDQLLQHDAVKAFYKPQQLITCNKIISTSVDDNKKLCVDQYRKLIYGIPHTKQKALSSSLGYSNSAKVITTGKTINSSLTQTKPTDKIEVSKKYSHQKLRANTAVQSTFTKLAPEDLKKYDKPILKYVRSAKEITKNSEAIQPTKKITQNLSKVQNQDESIGVKKQSYSAYVSSKVYQPKANLAKQNGLSSWKAVKSNLITTNISPKDIKQKIATFKSPKYININKVENVKIIKNQKQ